MICLIPAAGKSSRFLELGKHYPKCTLPYKGKPIINHIIESVNSAVLVDRFVIVTTEEQRGQIVDAIGSLASKLNVTVITVPASGRQGPARTILAGMAGIDPDEEVFVHLSDMICSSNMIKHFILRARATHFDNVVATVEVADKDFRRWCNYDYSTHNIIDKPEEATATELAKRADHHAIQALCGLYVLRNSHPSAGSMESDDNVSEFQISELLALNKFRAVPVNEGEILDFGTVQEYMKNKASPLSREFNKVRSHDKVFVKQSIENPSKLAAEAMIYQFSPENLIGYYPRIVKFDGVESELHMEKIRSTNLRDLYLFIDRSFETWARVFKDVRKFNDLCVKTSPRRSSSDSFWDFVVSKTSKRLAEIPFEIPGGCNFLSQLQQVVNSVKGNPLYAPSAYHGDLHFANMFYCFNYGDLKLVDPRGEFVGSMMYDVAKLMHSVYGNYDWIDSELFDIDSKIMYNRGNEEVVRAFEFVYSDILAEHKYNLLMITASLFLSMIPLHSHSKINQEMYRAEFVRIWNIATSIRVIYNG